MKRAAIALICVAASAGCGGGGGDKTSTVTAPPPAPTSTGPAKQPTATTNTPPPKHRTTPQPLTNTQSSTQPLRVTAPYKCNGKPLKAIAADGPVTVKPAIVKPGHSFTVTVTDPKVEVAVVSLAGVAPKPIQVNATRHGQNVAATIKMPGYATCGNKLLEIEGDVSAEAYVGVAR